MAEKNKRGFHTVEEPDMEEYERKLREHRVKVVKNHYSDRYRTGSFCGTLGVYGTAPL